MDPGTIAGDAGKWPFLVVMLLLTIGGLLIVSALIGVLATGLDRKLDDLRKGRSVVLERGHTLILGWSETIFTILAELASTWPPCSPSSSPRRAWRSTCARPPSTCGWAAS
jgi:ion channel POLLUX/CASTOR